MPDYKSMSGVPTPPEVDKSVAVVMEMARVLYAHQFTTRAVGECLSEQLHRMAEVFTALYAEALERRAEQQAYRQAVGIDSDQERE